MRALQEKPKIIYILGHAYSGSTLFSLALGCDARLLNLGEVSSLEHDYNKNKKCSCGEVLSKCFFWSRVKFNLEFYQNEFSEDLQWHLNDGSRKEFIDRRGRTLLERIKLAFGHSMSNIYGHSEIHRYRTKNEYFFDSVQRSYPDLKFIVDASKSPERLDILLESSMLEIWCIYLKRDPWSVAASSFKRFSKWADRNKYPRFPEWSRSALLRLPMGLLFAIQQRFEAIKCERIFSKISSKRCMVVHWEKFVNNPESELDKIKRKLWISSNNNEKKEKLSINPAQQHIYVGNRWLFSSIIKQVKIQLRHNVSNLTPSQRFVVRLVFGRERKIKCRTKE